MNSAVRPCWARAWARAPAVVAVSDLVSVLLTATLAKSGARRRAGFLSDDSFRAEWAVVVAVM